MELLPENKLIWSPVVANTRMNRERKASGINSYEKEFGFKPESFLEARIMENGHAAWVDLCCGRGNALNQTAAYLEEKGLMDKAILEGVDLLDTITSNVENKIRYQFLPLLQWKPEKEYDLITCSHGLHYIGDKIKAIQQAFSALKPTGLFIANLDLVNMVIEGETSTKYLKKIFSEHKIQYDGRKKLLQQTGKRYIEFGLEYKGADDKAGPNYTGQDVVTSYYVLQK
jgi:ubiquinone/menaquinone biosynthesis C-methylase UbiE